MDQHPLHGRAAKLLGANILTIQIRDNTTAIFAPPWPRPCMPFPLSTVTLKHTCSFAFNIMQIL